MPTDTKPPVRPFVDFLRTQRRGALADELAEQLATLVRAVRETGGTGTLTLAIKIKPADKRDTVDTLIIADEVRIKAPNPARGSSIFYPDQHGNLHRTDPRQSDLWPAPVAATDSTPTTQEESQNAN